MSQAVCLDDLPIRQHAFKEKYGQKYTNIEQCYNIAQFLHFIVSFPGTIDFVSLDHDLGDYTMDSKPQGQVLTGTGMDAAKLLCTVKDLWKPKAVNVHSHNYPRQEAMVDFLKRNGYPDATAEHFTDD